MQEVDNISIETHPWAPFLPEDARVLIMGTFPPGSHRWSMDFYYPNPTNDFWRIMGLLFMGDKNALYIPELKRFDLSQVKSLASQHHIAMNDTARTVRRLRGNASDKYLEIIEPVPLYDLLALMPQCKTIATTGEKAAGVIAEITSTAIPKMGEAVESSDGLTIWRMPSTSRAYPMKIENKAEYYRKMFVSLGLL